MIVVVCCRQIAVLDSKQRESDRFLLVVKQQLVQAQRELFDDLVLCCSCLVCTVDKCGLICNQLTSKVDGGITGSWLRWSILT